MKNRGLMARVIGATAQRQWMVGVCLAGPQLQHRNWQEFVHCCLRGTRGSHQRISRQHYDVLHVTLLLVTPIPPAVMTCLLQCKLAWGMMDRLVLVLLTPMLPGSRCEIWKKDRGGETLLHLYLHWTRSRSSCPFLEWRSSITFYSAVVRAKPCELRGPRSYVLCHQHSRAFAKLCHKAQHFVFSAKPKEMASITFRSAQTSLVGFYREACKWLSLPGKQRQWREPSHLQEELVIVLTGSRPKHRRYRRTIVPTSRTSAAVTTLLQRAARRPHRRTPTTPF